MEQSGIADKTYYKEILSALNLRAKILFNYKPLPAEFPVALLKASEEALQHDDDPQNYWRQLIKSLTTFMVKGNHDTMLDDKYLPDFIKSFKLAINKLICDK